MNRYHFISGLPRSGSTLLSSILNQNPKFHAGLSNPLARFVRAIISESFAAPGYKLQCDEPKRIKLIQNLIKTYHEDYNKEVCFNTNRGWTALIKLLKVACPSSKVICCVRDINWILDSFEILFRKNPFNMSSLYSLEEAETVYTRCNALMSPGHTLRFAYDSLKEAITGTCKSNLFLVEYELLCKNPDLVIRSLYNFIEEPYFEHDFNNVEVSYDEYDAETNIIGLHKIRKEIKFIERTPIIPPDIWNSFSNLEVWR